MRRLLPLVLLCECGRSVVYEPASTTTTLPDSGRSDGGTDAGAGFDAGLIDIAASLNGLRWELPCLMPHATAPEYVCISTAETRASTALTGAPGRRYRVRLRLRGVVETKEYPGGAALRPGGPVVSGGNPVADAWNVYRLDISSPPQRYHLNQGPTGLYVCRTLDEEILVDADGLARFTLFGSTIDASRSEIRNRDVDGGSFVVPGVPPAPAPYDGQFIQLDVLGVTAL